MQQWTAEQAQAWYGSKPFLFGCNFLPSTAVNSTEMWQADTFDPETIGNELKWARGLGYNTIRVFMQYIVWEADPTGLKDRMDAVLSLADRNGISMMPILFDDCAFADRDPYLGKQDDPVPGVHNSQWTPSPGFANADNRDVWPQLKDYVEDLLSAFGDDPRVLIWDLYNEPGNSGRIEKSIPLLEAAFRWARIAGPTQPITAGSYGWTGTMKPLGDCCERNSDVVSFHCYGGINVAQGLIHRLAEYKRPVLCTEWLHRPLGSRFQTHLGIFKQEQVGIYNWGLVEGKTQTYLNWYTMHGTPNPNAKEWQHDVLRTQGGVYDPEEIAAIRLEIGEDLIMNPVDMTPHVMQDLEDRGLIIRLRPGAHEIDTPPGETLGESIYDPAVGFGPHKLIAVTVNREEFAGFATHPDNEEFLLIGNLETKPMYLAVATCMRAEFVEKVKTGILGPQDFVLLRCRYNDPEVSFFVMKKNVPHGEAIVEADLPPATFYVTESRDLPLDVIEMRKYRLKVR